MNILGWGFCGIEIILLILFAYSIGVSKGYDEGYKRGYSYGFTKGHIDGYQMRDGDCSNLFEGATRLERIPGIKQEATND